MSDRAEQQFGNYRLLRLLGSGGFAEVYLAEHIYLNTLAAIKVIHAPLSPQHLDAFRFEARTIAHLVHPHIIRVLEFGSQDSIPFLVMDYAPNGTLRQKHPPGSAVPLSLVASYLRQLSAALHYAHSNKLIHRDIKPENMLLNASNQVLLSDFGVATFAYSTVSFTEKEMAGTVPYMAPEQFDGHPRFASDQYALGIVIYEWLCGERPFQGTFFEVAAKHRMEPPRSLREMLPALSPLVEQVVMTTLAKDPRERFSSIQAFATAFENAVLEAQKDVGSISTVSSLPREEVTPVGNNTAGTQVATSADVISPPGASTGTSENKVAAASAETASSQQSTLLSVSTPVRSRQGVSRRTILLGLGGLTLAGGVSWLILNHVLLQPAPSSIPTVVTCSRAFSDDFKTSLNSRWTWTNPENDTNKTVDGRLHVTVPVNHDLYRDLTNAPRLLQPIDGNFTIETCVDIAPVYKYQGAGVLVWQDTQNFIRLERGHGDFDGISFEQEINGNFTKFVQAFYQADSMPTNSTRIGLRIQRAGYHFIAWWQDTNARSDWKKVSETLVSLQNSLMVGLAVVNSPASSQTLTATFEYFHVTCS